MAVSLNKNNFPSFSGFLNALAFVFVALLASEVGARLDDWFFDGVPFFENPSYDGLFIIDEHGNRRGKPGAYWKRVRMNNLGMRGADVPVQPEPNCRRWMFLGASETFGEPSTADKEFAAQVSKLAAPKACIRSMNPSFPAFFLRDFPRQYRLSLAQYKPDVVFIYPSTHLYLGDKRDETPKTDAPPADTNLSQPQRDLVAYSRIYDRLKGAGLTPEFIQKMRVRRWIDDASKGRPPEWKFNEVPQQRLDRLTQDLRDTIDAIRASGAEPVLMTHAVRATQPPRPEDFDDLTAMRVYVPRASEKVLVDFEYAAAENIRNLGKETGTRVIDVARLMSGRRDQFIDLVHFAPAGHLHVAELIVNDMQLNTGRE